MDTAGQSRYLSREERVDFAKELAEARNNMEPSRWSQPDVAAALVRWFCRVVAGITPTPPADWQSFDSDQELHGERAFALENLRESLLRMPQFAHVVAQRVPTTDADRDAAEKIFREEVKKWRDRIGNIEAARFRLDRRLQSSIRYVLTLGRKGWQGPALSGGDPFRPFLDQGSKGQGVPYVDNIPSTNPRDKPGDEFINLSPLLNVKPHHHAFRVQGSTYAPTFFDGEWIVVSTTDLLLADRYAVIVLPDGRHDIAMLFDHTSPPVMLATGEPLPEGAGLYGYIVHREWTASTGLMLPRKLRQNSERN